MPECFFIKRVDSANNATFGRRSRLVVRRNAAIGDSICASVVADRLVQMGLEVEWQTHSTIVPVMRHQPRLANVVPARGRADVNLDDAYEKAADKRDRHFHDFFFRAANRWLSGFGINLGRPSNCKPHLVVPVAECNAVLEQLAGHPRPWTFICPRSTFYTTRTVADGVWEEAARGIYGTKFWLGIHSPAPPAIVDLRPQSAVHVLRLLTAADLLVTVDTGPLHMAAALDVPSIVIEQSSLPRFHLNDQNDYDVVTQPLDCLHCMALVCPKRRDRPPCQYPSVAAIVTAANRRLEGRTRVSCVIPTFASPGGRLARTIAAVYPQVDEVVVTRDAGGKLPGDAPQLPNVRYVQAPVGGLGFGRNVNFGVRHTRGEFILILNDDCYLEGDAVVNLVREMRDARVGCIGHLLRYPNGRICHGGKFRKPGMRGWGLLDNRQYHPTLKHPTRVENVTGTSILVRRKAFYDANGFDEDFFLYCEDDAFCMQLGQRGWHILYTPHAKGVHDEAATTHAVARSGDIMPWVRQGNATFGRKWGWWIEKNLAIVPGEF